MSVVFILVGISICLALFFLGAFIWSVKNGQYEDDYTPSVRILFEDELVKAKDHKEVKIKKSINKN